MVSRVSELLEMVKDLNETGNTPFEIVTETTTEQDKVEVAGINFTQSVS